MEGIIFIILVSLIILVICREILCWYWKINESLENQRKIIDRLDKLVGKEGKEDPEKPAE